MNSGTISSRIDRLMGMLGEQPDRPPLSNIAKLNKLIHVLSSSIYHGDPDPGLPKLVNLLDPDAKVTTPEEAAEWVEEFFARRQAQRAAEMEAEGRQDVYRRSSGGTFADLAAWDRPAVSKLEPDPFDGIYKPKQPDVPAQYLDRDAYIASKEFETRRAEEIGKFDEADGGWRLPPKSGSP